MKSIFKDYTDISLNKDIEIDTNRKLITVLSYMTDEQLYSFIKMLWVESPYHIQFLFPMMSYTDVFGDTHVGIINGWNIVGIQLLTKEQK